MTDRQVVVLLARKTGAIAIWLVALFLIPKENLMLGAGAFIAGYLLWKGPIP